VLESTYTTRLHIHLKYFSLWPGAEVIILRIWRFQFYDPKNLSLDIPGSQLVWAEFLGNDFATFTAARVKNSHAITLNLCCWSLDFLCQNSMGTLHNVYEWRRDMRARGK
jgi:hypothetical protein